MSKNYRFIEDPGHGWLEVPVLELIELGIVHLISSCSYLHPSGKMAYLEEDCDVATFALAKGWSPTGTLPMDLIETVYEDPTFVRELPSFPTESTAHERSRARARLAGQRVVFGKERNWRERGTA
jgi:hypothetical protein